MEFIQKHQKLISIISIFAFVSIILSSLLSGLLY